MWLGQQNCEVVGGSVFAVGGSCRAADLEGMAGWELIQRDWGLRQREPGHTRASRFVRRLGALVQRLAARMFHGPAGVAHAGSTSHDR